MEPLEKLVKSFEGGNILTNEELNLVVAHINRTVDYINDNIKPAIENGIRGLNGRDGRDGVDGVGGSDGISSLTAFVGAANLNSALNKLGSRNLTTYPPGQYSSSSNVPIGENEVLFMTSAKCRGENDWLYGEDNYIWSIPVLLGSNTTSTTGTDSEKFNYIYCRTLRNIDASDFYPVAAGVLKSILTYVENNPGSGIRVIPASSTVANIGNITVANNNADTLEGVWTDHPCGISEYLPHEWMVGYLKNEYDEWEYYFGPTLISNYGFNGLDGDGLEYIFMLSASDVTPTLVPPYTGTVGGNSTLLSGVTVASSNYLLDDFVPNGWSDEPLTPSEYLPYLYVSTRKRGGNQEGNSTWEAFTTPKLWNKYSSPGKNGSFVLEAYKNAGPTILDITPYLPTNTNEFSNELYPPTDWTVSPENPGLGEYTWCIQRNVEYTSQNQPIYYAWGDPFRITGDNGEAGADGKYMEYVYKRFTEAQTWSSTAGDYTNPANWPITDNHLTDEHINPQREDYLGPTSYLWSDNPEGITHEYKYEYCAQRIYDGENYHAFGTPFLWSRYGDKGRDGDGYEYIFKGFSSELTTWPLSGISNPANWDSNTAADSLGHTWSDDDYCGPSTNEWQDDPVSVNDSDCKFVYVSMRKKVNNEWLSFSTPSLWSHYVPQGVAGLDGSYTLFAYKNATSSPEAPVSNSTYPPTNWTLTPSTPNFAEGYYTWCITRTITFDSSNNPIYTDLGAWCTPYRITGDNGLPGEDGDMTEFIYTRNNGDSNGDPNPPSAPPVNGTYPKDWPRHTVSDTLIDYDTDGNGVIWTDNPKGVGNPGILGNYKYEYISSRLYDGSTQTWGNYTTPRLWSNWGEKGQDGDGYEYIYHRYDTEITDWSQITGDNNPLNWTNLTGFQSDDYLGPSGYTWEDDPQGVTSATNEKFEYVSVRKKLNNTWGAFSVPALWAQYVPPGTSGQNGQYVLYAYRNATEALKNTNGFAPSSSTAIYPPTDWSTTATTPDFANGKYTWCITRTISFDSNNSPLYGNWSSPYRITGDNGEPGEDGDMTEFIYKRFAFSPLWGNSNANPNYWAANQTSDYLGPSGNEWSDNPSGVNNDYPYEFVSSREYKYQTLNATTKTWGKFSIPALWSKYGLNGRDGDGFEYIFKGFADEQTTWASSGAANANENPANWSANQASDYLGPTGYEWSDEPVAVDSSTNKFVYVSSRKKYYTNSGASNATWHTFSTPKLWALYVAPGTVGPSGQYTQFIFKTTSFDLSQSSNYLELGTSNASTPYGWSSTASTPQSSTAYIWCSHRTVTPGISSTTYGNWCNPYKISGNNGSDGGSTTVVYQIVSSLNEFHYKTNHAGNIIWNPSTVNFDIYLFQGSTFTKLSTLELLANLTMERRINTGGSSFSGTSSITIGSNNISDLATYTNNDVTLVGEYIEISLNYNGTRVSIINIPVVRDYTRMLIPNGAYLDKEYTITNTTIPLVFASDNKYYYLDADTNKTGTSPNYTYIAPTDSNLLVWAEATEYKILLTDALFANFAKLGSFIIYDKYFFSQFGYVVDSSGNTSYKDSNSNVLNYYLYFDPNDPMAETLPTSGNYKFKPMKVINAESGEEWMAGGNLYIDKEGRANFKGTVLADNLYKTTAFTWGGVSGVTTRVLNIGSVSSYVSNKNSFVKDSSIWLFIKNVDTENPNSDLGILTKKYNLQVNTYFELTLDIYDDTYTYEYNGETYADPCRELWDEFILPAEYSDKKFIPCTYNADTVIATGLVALSSGNDHIVYLPRAQDFPGKLVEVCNSKKKSNGGVRIIVKPVNLELMGYSPILSYTGNSEYTRDLKFQIEVPIYPTSCAISSYAVGAEERASFYSDGTLWIVLSDDNGSIKGVTTSFLITRGNYIDTYWFTDGILAEVTSRLA